MPPELPAPGSPEDWLRYVRSDLTIASQRELTPGVLLQMLCFHAQQAVEKSIKAVLVHQGITFPYTHDIAVLVTLVKNSGFSWSEEFNQAADLTVYAVINRYPRPTGEISEQEYQ